MVWNSTKIFKIILIIICILCCAPKKTIWQGKYISVTTTGQPKEDFKADKYVVVAYETFKYQKQGKVVYQFSIYENNDSVGLIELKYDPELPISDTVTFYFLLEDNYTRFAEIYYISKHGDRLIYQVYVGCPTYEQIKKDIITVLSGGELFPPSPFDKDETRWLFYLID
jgi:hypothetical protein